MRKGAFFIAVRKYENTELKQISGWIYGTIGCYKNIIGYWIAVDLATGLAVSSEYKSRKGAQGVISYGMTQEEAEKILGEGIEWQTRKNTYLYNEHGVSVAYRDNSLCFIEATRTGLTLFNGVKIGDSKDEIKKKFDCLHMDSVKMFSAYFDESLKAVEVTPDIRNDYSYAVMLYFDLDVLEKVL